VAQFTKLFSSALIYGLNIHGRCADRVIKLSAGPGCVALVLPLGIGYAYWRMPGQLALFGGLGCGPGRPSAEPTVARLLGALYHRGQARITVRHWFLALAIGRRVLAGSPAGKSP
jgi:hypothetical protein